MNELGRRMMLAGGGATFALALVGRPRRSDAAPGPAGEPFARFLPRGFSAARDDVAPHVEAAARWSAVNRTPVIVSGAYGLGRTVRFTDEGTLIFFDRADFRLSSQIAAAQTRRTGVVQAGLHILADKVSLLGSCRLSTAATQGKTFLQGIFAEEADDLALGRFDLQNLAIGQHFMGCDRIICDDSSAHGMWGLQRSGAVPAGAGSAQVISACRDSRFGRLDATDNDKCARYLSVGVHSASGRRDNVGNEFGFVTATGRLGSVWAQNTAVRSSVDGRFAGGSGSGLSYLLLCQKYATDNAYRIDGNDFGNWNGEIIDSRSSVDAAIYFDVKRGATEIGSNRIGYVSARCSQAAAPGPNGYPQTFGLFSTSGTLMADTFDFDGFTFHINASGCKLDIELMRSSRAAYQVMQYGRGLSGRIGRLEIADGISGSIRNAGLIRPMDYGPIGRPPRFRIEQLDCPAANCDRTDYLVYDPMFPKGAMQVGKINGRGSMGAVRSRN